MTFLRTDRAASADRAGDRGIPDVTVARLPVYLRALAALTEAGTVTCSSGELAAAAGVNPAKLRKDLSYLGSYGTRGVGYDVALLHHHISRELGQSEVWDVVIVGAGHLGSALSTYQGFDSRGINVKAILDVDPARIGTELAGVRVRPFDALEEVVRESRIAIAVVATPGEAAQGVADALVEAGVTSILNFAPAVLQVPESVQVRKVDLSIELQILAYHEQRKGSADVAGPTHEEVAG